MRRNNSADFRPTGAGSYTSRMDAVRFGRALGFGARQAVKTVVTAVDAATAENPSAKADRARTGVSVQRTGTASVQGSAASDATATTQVQTPQRPPVQPQILPPERKQMKKQSRDVRRGLRHFGEATWRPFVRLGGVLWLEVTGVFFGIFAAFAASGMWRFRAAWRLSATNSHDHQSFVGSTAMAMVFGYFCVSGFVRARRRERGR